MADMSRLTETLRRYVWVWPVLMAGLTLVGFKWMSPNARLVAVEQAQAQMPESVKVAIERQVAPLRQAIEDQRTRDSVTQVQLTEIRTTQQGIQRQVTVGTLIQCRSLPTRDVEFLRQLAIACEQTSQRSGIQYRQPPSP